MKIVLMAFSVLFASQVFAEDSLYFYLNQERRYFPIDTSRLMTKWDSSTQAGGLQEAVQDFQNLDSVRFERNKLNGFNLHWLRGDFNFDSVFTLIGSDNRVVRVTKVLRVDERSSILAGDEILCKFRPEISRRIIDSVLNESNLEILRESEYIRNRFLIQLETGCAGSVFEMANALYELPESEWSHPNYTGNFWLDGYSVLDAYYQSDQWNVARAVDHISDSNYGAWEITRGSANVLIAVLDGGMENHIDLDTTIWDGGYDFVDLDFDPSPILPEPDTLVDGHGMQVLGLIAGIHNNIVGPPTLQLRDEPEYLSVAGVSPQVRILPLRTSRPNGLVVDAEKLETAIMMAKNVGADVINCSWGGPASTHPDAVRDAIDSALFNGRNGKGCIVVGAAGNEAGFQGPHFPAAQDSVISVGAIAKNDYVFNFSNPGDWLDVLAPSAASGKPQSLIQRTVSLQ